MTRPPAGNSEKTPWNDWEDLIILILWGTTSAIIAHNIVRWKDAAKEGRA